MEGERQSERESESEERGGRVKAKGAGMTGGIDRVFGGREEGVHQKIRGWKIGQSNAYTNRKQTISEGCTDV